MSLNKLLLPRVDLEFHQAVDGKCLGYEACGREYRPIGVFLVFEPAVRPGRFFK